MQPQKQSGFVKALRGLYETAPLCRTPRALSPRHYERERTALFVKLVIIPRLAAFRQKQAPLKRRGPMPKIYSKAGRAGCVQLRKAQSTGLLVGVYNSTQAGLDAAVGACAWSTVCEVHSTIIGHATRRWALDWASVPEQWCEGCKGI